ncbi:carbohydrate ABC transporter substrate-binding protein (CUT1 family) [Paenibacillus cellulosilyticus]|uniref:Carbohydrate ABC transporter substrate-binding protein (CUT1 family) n=1 Tax=Paenibacillus cellulosilyticus TaxID=375489 RepID=A0A2V2YT02_9BACL|nr:extracellular solute-binding protein [Paenibacillus cellulosilyticus]PWW02389.1 carbohydrate ABC transporter substrate-binding protein (CUT1 family) [Paenibacillus cellulosilyticus]QKS47102.1 extracellular solute-binding protein [Paenibacillus cellulosilyticus]
MKTTMHVLLLATMLTATGVMAGCSSNNNESESLQVAGSEKQQNADEASSASTNDSGSSYLASDKPLKLTVHMGTKDSGVFKNDWPIFVKAAALTNITLEGTLPSTVTDFTETFNTVMASNNLPDIMEALDTNFLKYGKEGAYLKLNDLIDQYAPHLKKFLDDNPDVRSASSDKEGNIWFIPFIQDGLTQKGWFIREDWLSKLGLQEPKTVEELHNVLTAFVTKDPNGNGQKDEVGYFSRDTNKGLEGLLALWNAYLGYRVFDDKVIYGPLQSEFGTALENMAKWYKEGLIDKEIFTRGVKARDILLAENTGGLTHDYFASTGNYNDQLASKIQGFQFNPMLPPADVNGVVKEPTRRPRATNHGWGISYSNPDPVATIKYFDFWFTEEGRRMANFGIEGDTYTMVDGKPIFSDKVMKSDMAPVEMIRATGAQSEFGFQQDYSYEEQWTTPVTVEGIKKYTDNNVFMDLYPTLKFTDEEQKEIEKVAVKVETYVTETMQKWLLGGESVNDEAFVKELKRMGADHLVEINQAAYDRYKAELK